MAEIKQAAKWMDDVVSQWEVVKPRETRSSLQADKIAAKDEQIVRLKALLREWREVWNWLVADASSPAPEEYDGLPERSDKELGNE